MNNFEVITTHDKEKRDEIFRDLRANSNDGERQAVKFSGADTWSVAHPRDVEKPRHGSKRNPRKFPRRKYPAKRHIQIVESYMEAA